MESWFKGLKINEKWHYCDFWQKLKSYKTTLYKSCSSGKIQQVAKITIIFSYKKTRSFRDIYFFWSETSTVKKHRRMFLGWLLIYYIFKSMAKIEKYQNYSCNIKLLHVREKIQTVCLCLTFCFIFVLNIGIFDSNNEASDK